MAIFFVLDEYRYRRFLWVFCGEQGIGLAFYTEYGKLLARVQGKQTGNVLLRRAQYRWADDEEKCNKHCTVNGGGKNC